MELRKIKTLAALLLLFPLLMANKNCQRNVTWEGKMQGSVSKWIDDHEEVNNRTSCSECHEDPRSSLNRVAPPSHRDVSWKHEHGKYSQIKYGFKQENICELCHTEATCAQCHQQEEPPNHTHFWKIQGHGVMAGLDRSKCITCHADESFCVRCHQQTEPRNHTASFGGSQNNHCGSCHLPLSSSDAQKCAVCHESSSLHSTAPAAPPRAFHVEGNDCLDCHTPLGHINNGDACTLCHAL